MTTGREGGYRGLAPDCPQPPASPGQENEFLGRNLYPQTCHPSYLATCLPVLASHSQAYPWPHGLESSQESGHDAWYIVSTQ